MYHNAESIERCAYGTLYNLPILKRVYSLVNTSVPDLRWVFIIRQFHLHAQRRSEIGHRRAYYTEATLTAHESHLIWGFTEKLLVKDFV